MELGHDENIRLLIESGADVRLPQPGWDVQSYTCPIVPKAVWLEATTALEELMITVEEIKDEISRAP